MLERIFADLCLRKNRMDENQVMFSTEEKVFPALPWIWCWSSWEIWKTADKNN
jgi:hypothetical protein